MIAPDTSGSPMAAECSRAGTDSDHTRRSISPRAARTSESRGRHSAGSVASVERRAPPDFSRAMLSPSPRNGAADVGVTTDSPAVGRRLVVHARALVDLDRPGRMISDVASATPATNPLGLWGGAADDGRRQSNRQGAH